MLETALLTTCLLLACGSAPEGTSPEPVEPAHTPGCQAPAAVSNQPHSIDETVAFINALPKPLSLPCFVEALGRPLQLNAARSSTSAQPAVGQRSPRIFLKLETLTLSVVPAGMGASLLEMGEARPGLRSLKGELEFPIQQALPPSAAYDNAMYDETITSCAFCHATEEPESLAWGGRGFVSQALRPYDSQRVPLTSVAAEAASCDRALEAERCAILHALFGWGPSLSWDFPAEMDRF